MWIVVGAFGFEPLVWYDGHACVYDGSVCAVWYEWAYMRVWNGRTCVYDGSVCVCVCDGTYMPCVMGRAL